MKPLPMKKVDFKLFQTFFFVYFSSVDTIKNYRRYELGCCFCSPQLLSKQTIDFVCLPKFKFKWGWRPSNPRKYIDWYLRKYVMERKVSWKKMRNRKKLKNTNFRGYPLQMFYLGFFRKNFFVKVTQFVYCAPYFIRQYC